MQLRCKHCNAEIPTKDISPTQQLISCPACDAVFGTTGQFEARLVNSTPWPGKLSFGGLSVETSEKELSITRRWFDKSKHLGMGFVGLLIAGFVTCSMLNSGDFLFAFIIPHTWMACQISTSANLSPSTLRILQHTFGQVAMSDHQEVK